MNVYQKKFTVTSDGHTQLIEFNRESSSDEYEVDYRVKHIRESSGKTKRQQPAVLIMVNIN